MSATEFEAARIWLSRVRVEGTRARLSGRAAAMLLYILRARLEALGERPREYHSLCCGVVGFNASAFVVGRREFVVMQGWGSSAVSIRVTSALGLFRYTAAWINEILMSC